MELKEAIDEQSNLKLDNKNTNDTAICGVPSATTISTIVVYAEPHTKIVLGILKSIGYTQLRIDEMKPRLLEIGNELAITIELINSHNDLCAKLTDKEPQINDLIERANSLVAQQTDQNNAIVYAAMAESLSAAWKELSRQLDLRGYILRDTRHFYEMSIKHEALVQRINELLQDQSNNYESIQQHIDELTSLTVEAVDAGSNIIMHIRVLGALADNDHRPQEIVDACLIIEKVMLRIAHQWETIASGWSETKTITYSLTAEQQQNLVDQLNIAKSWLDAAKETYHTAVAAADCGASDATAVRQTAEILVAETKTQKELLEKIEVSNELNERRTNILKEYDEFQQLLETKLLLSERIQQFYQSADSTLNQLAQMANELMNANASMAGELGPLAHQKTSAIINEGSDILQNGEFTQANETDYEKINHKLTQLRQQLFIIEEMARERIHIAKTLNTKLQAQLQALNKWLENGPEAFLASIMGIGTDYQTCVEFLTQHKQISTDVTVHEPELQAILCCAPEMASADRKLVSDLERRFNVVRQTLETRLEVGKNFEQIQKFSHQLDTSMNSLNALLNASPPENYNVTTNVSQQIRDVFQSIKETLQREKHHGEKFIAGAKLAGASDVCLQVANGIEIVEALILAHENRLIQLNEKCDGWQASQVKAHDVLRLIEEISSWQREQASLMNSIEKHIQQQQQQIQQQPQSAERTYLLNRAIESIEQFPYIKRKFLSIEQLTENNFSQNTVDNLVKQQNEIEKKLLKLHEQLLIGTLARQSQSIPIETISSSITTTSQIENLGIQRPPSIISGLQDKSVIEGTRVEFIVEFDAGLLSNCIWTKDRLPIPNTLDYRTEIVNGRATLVIEETFIEDTALYALQIKNAVGIVETVAKLTVKPKLGYQTITSTKTTTMTTTKTQITNETPQKPNFVRQLQNLNVVEGGNAILDCVLVASPEPQVIWLKNEECIRESDRINLQFIGDHCSLAIQSVTPNDAGIYQVKATNVYGESTNFCRLNITSASPTRKIPPPTPPKPTTPSLCSPTHSDLPNIPERPAVIDMPLVNQFVSEGQRAIFQAHVLGSPPPKITWLFGNQPIPLEGNNEFKIEPALGFTRLIIFNVIPQLGGIYTIIAQNSTGETRSDATLIVDALPKVFNNFYEEKNIHQLPSFQQQQQQLPRSTTIVQTTHDVDALLREYSSPRDFGDMGFSSIANAPEFIRPFQSEYTIDEGEKVQIDCLMVGNPRPRVNWFFNDRPIQSNYQFVEFTNIGDSYVINLSPARLEHSGYYRMIAENIRGKTESLTLIHVRPRSMIPQFIGRTHRTQSLEQQRLIDEFGLYNKPQRSSASPYFMQRFATPPLSAMKRPVLYGDNQQMTTSFYQPQANYPSNYRSNSITRMTSHNTFHQPKINQKQQYGYHTNYDNNPTIGDYNASTEENHSSPPHFRQTLVSCVVNVGEPTKFEVIVTGVPEPTLDWSMDGESIDTSINNNALISNDNGHATLQFIETGPEHNGKYMCTARNEFGIATSSAQLVVRPKTIAPDFTKRLVSEEVAEGEKLKWTVHITGDPLPKVTWLRDGQLIPNCPEVCLTQDTPFEYSMIIQRVEPADAGQFTCLLENDAGEARSTADLVVRPSGSKPGNYFHITKVTQEKQVKGEEMMRNEAVSVEPPQTDL